jgi:hypothetical protein
MVHVLAEEFLRRLIRLGDRTDEIRHDQRRWREIEQPALVFDALTQRGRLGPRFGALGFETGFALAKLLQRRRQERNELRERLGTKPGVGRRGMKDDCGSPAQRFLAIVRGRGSVAVVERNWERQAGRPFRALCNF